MASPLSLPVARARPPAELVPWLAAPGVHALDTATPGGWRTPAGGAGSGESLLACEPEVVFAGGLEALAEAQRWLAEWRGDEPLAALLIGTISYDLGREFERIPARIAPEPVDDLPPVRLAAFRAVYRRRAGGRGEVVGSDSRAVARLRERVECASARARAPALPGLPKPRTTRGLSFSARLRTRLRKVRLKRFRDSMGGALGQRAVAQ